MIESRIKERVEKAIEVLGAPVMDYAPAIALREYDDKIKRAVTLLLEVSRLCSAIK